MVLRTVPAAVAMGAAAVAGRFSGARGQRAALIDGAPGLAWAPSGVPRVVFRFTCRGGRIAAIDQIANPEAIAGLSVRLNR